MSHFTHAPFAVACAVLSAFHRIARGTNRPHLLRQRTLRRVLAKPVGSETEGGAPKALFLSTVIAICVLIFHADAFAQTTPPPHRTWQPTTNTPSRTAPTKTQSTKTETHTTQSQFHQGNKEHGRGYSHGGGGVGVGIGATIDLGGIGQRSAEPDPFALRGAAPPIAARTEQTEKPPPAKKRRAVAKTDPFANVQLTGPQAKSETEP